MVVHTLKGVYITTAALFSTSLLYTILSERHIITRTAAMIFVLEIISNSCDAASFYYIRGDNAQLYLNAVGFTTHWLAIGIFTGAYIKVGTQTPLMLPHRRCTLAPVSLNVAILLILSVSFYTAVYVNNAASYLTWIAFTTKIGLALFIFLIQLASLRSIRDMILNAEDLVLLKTEFYEHIFVFGFFAIMVVVEASIELVFNKYGHVVETQAEMKGWRATYITLAIFYAICNLCFISILQGIWSFKANNVFECPILGEEVSFVVFVKNRHIVRVKNSNWHVADKNKVAKKKLVGPKPSDFEIEEEKLLLSP